MRGAAAPAGAARETIAEGGKKKEGRRDRNGICQESPAPSASINCWPGRVCKATSTYRMFLFSTTMFSQPGNQRDVNGRNISMLFSCFFFPAIILGHPLAPPTGGSHLKISVTQLSLQPVIIPGRVLRI